jgi:hypothetical protein
MQRLAKGRTEDLPIANFVPALMEIVRGGFGAGDKKGNYPLTTSSPKWSIFSSASDVAGKDRYPCVSYWEADRYHEHEFREFPLEFRLIYQGPLLAQKSKSRVQHKHDIRKKIHHQLAELWKTTMRLSDYRVSLGRFP